MMYTPTPATRRPRPPGSLSRTRSAVLPSRTDVSESTTNRTIKEKLSSSSLPDQTRARSSSATRRSDDNADVDTPMSVYIRERKDGARDALRRITASPAEIEDISVELDVASSASPVSHSISRGRTRVMAPIGLGLPVAINLPASKSIPASTSQPDFQPSPPPPYGQILPTHTNSTQLVSQINTPPSQDTGGPSRQASTSLAIDDSEEKLHEAHSKEGIQPFFDVASTLIKSQERLSGDEIVDETGDDMVVQRVRERYQDVKEQLQRRDDDLLARLLERMSHLHPSEGLIASHSKLARPHNHHIELTALDRSDLHQPQFQENIATGSRDTISLNTSLSQHDFDTSEDLDDSFPDWSRHDALLPNRLLPQGSTAASTLRSILPRYARLEAQQAENEERVIALETALHEAQANEEKQRKLVARLRKEVEKLQRDLIKSEERALESPVAGNAQKRSTGIRRPVFAQKWSKQDLHDRPADMASSEEEEYASAEAKLGWGSTAFPEFPQATSSRQHAQSRTISSEEEEAVARAHAKARTVSFSEQDPPRALARRRLSKRSVESNMFSPAKSGDAMRLTSLTKSIKSPFPPTPQVKVLSPTRSGASANSRDLHHGSPARSRRSSSGGRSIRRSPWPFARAAGTTDSTTPDPRRTLEFGPARGLSATPSPGVQLTPSSKSPSLSPAFASLSSKVASMHAYISRSLDLTVPLSSQKGKNRGTRTLGSELGSEFGDDWNQDGTAGPIHASYLHASSPSPSPLKARGRSSPAISNVDQNMLVPERRGSEGQSSAAETLLQDEVDGEEDDSDQTNSHPPFPLPPNVSAALSTLATALAPASFFALHSNQTDIRRQVDHLPRRLTLDRTTSRSSATADPARRIRWSEGNPRSDQGPLNGAAMGQGLGRGLSASHRSPAVLGRRTNLDPTETDDQSEDTDWADEDGDGDDGENEDEHDEEVNEVDNGLGGSSHANEQVGLVRPVPSQILRNRGVASSDTPTRRISLAHRRVNSFNASTAVIARRHPGSALSPVRSGAKGVVSRTKSTTVAVALRQNQSGTAMKPMALEPSTVPARIVHDLFCLLSIYAEYAEWMLILFIKIIIDVRSGPRGGA